METNGTNGTNRIFLFTSEFDIRYWLTGLGRLWGTKPNLSSAFLFILNRLEDAHSGESHLVYSAPNSNANLFLEIPRQTQPEIMINETLGIPGSSEADTQNQPSQVMVVFVPSE